MSHRSGTARPSQMYAKQSLGTSYSKNFAAQTNNKQLELKKKHKEIEEQKKALLQLQAKQKQLKKAQLQLERDLKLQQTVLELQKLQLRLQQLQQKMLRKRVVPTPQPQNVAYHSSQSSRNTSVNSYFRGTRRFWRNHPYQKCN